MTRRVRDAVMLLNLLLLLCIAAAPAYAVNPHGGFTSITQNCAACHGSHDATGTPILHQPTERALCLSCHDGSASAFNVLAEFASGTESKHPADAGGTMQCGSCHTAHRGPAEGNPASIAVTGTASVTGSAVCAGCHGTDSTLAGGDLAGAITGTPHDLDGPADSLADIGCRACHEPHASSNDSLIRTAVASAGATVTVTSEQRVCFACHDSQTDAYSGPAIASAAKHFTVTTSTKALTVYPGGGQACNGCHEPHGTGSGPALTRLSGRQLCEQCHDASGLVYGANYSYQGQAAFAASGHSGASAGTRFVNVGPATEGFAVWESTSAPTPASPGTPVSAERAATLGATDGNRLVTSLQSTTGGHDYQLYRFKLPVATSGVVSASVTWVGYGEETPGYPVIVSLWRNDTGAWEQIANRVMGTQQRVTVPVDTGMHVNADGYVYLLADSLFVRDGQLVSGPTFTALSDTSMLVEWVTAGTSSSWVDYGPTSSFGQTAGSAARVTNHAVTVSGLATGVWSFRVRSVSPEGEDYTSETFTFALPAPTLAPPLPPDQTWLGTPLSATLYWNALTGTRGPYEYRVEINGVWTSWMSGTSYTYSFDSPGEYRWRVEARDSYGVSHPPSSYDAFQVYDGTSSGSCPFLFTWDGEKYAFEADLYGPGKLALKTKSGYAKPTPDDVYVLKNSPAAKDGRIALTLVEERWEVDYLDTLALYAIDAPADRDVYAEKREAGGASFNGVESVLHTVSRTMAAPESVVHVQSDQDVTALIAEDDGEQLVLNEDRNAGFTYQTLELDLGDVQDAPQVKVVMDAMSMFPTTEDGTARASGFGARTKLEVQDAGGDWVTIPASQGALPKPPEFSRPYAFDLSDIWVSDSRKVRFTFLMKTYIDWIAIDTTVDVPVQVTEVPLSSAVLRERGYDSKSTDGELYEYTYGEPTGVTEYFPGAYTRLGDVQSLLSQKDDMFVIYGGGDEIEMTFEQPQASSGTTRRYVIHTNGYYKDAKTDVDETVEPLPFAAMTNFPYPETESYPSDSAHEAYRAQWNTRMKPDGSGESIAAASAEEPSILTTAGEWLQATFNDAWTTLVWTVSAEGGLFGPDEYPVTHRSLNTDAVAIDLSVTSAVSAGGECGACHSMHGASEGGRILTGGRAASDGRTCTAAGTGCHSSAANSASGVNINEQFTSSADPRAHHDVMVADQTATGSSIACADCHNPHTDNASVRYSDPDDVSKTIASPLESLINADGELYVLVGADHDGMGPEITGVVDSPAADPTTDTITWTTNEPATTWVEWGPTTSYENGKIGNDTLATAHSVQLTGLASGTTYHYRVRSTDALGNTSISSDRTYRPTAPPSVPVPVDETTFSGTGWGPITLNALDASSVTSSDGHAVQYEFLVDGATSSGWLNSPTWVTPEWFYDGAHSFQVRARDAVETYAVSAWSGSDAFTVTGAADPGSGSCPFLFTWDGSAFRFEADMLMSGKLANKISTGYQKPNPQDAYTLSTKPEAIDGLWQFRLVEERYETDYIDQVQVFAADAPAGYTVLAEKPGVGGTVKEVAAQLHTVKDPVAPANALRTDTGEDISATIAEDDEDFVVLNEDREDFSYKTIELDLGDAASASQVKLVIDGVSAFFQTPQGTANSAKFGPRTKVEVQKPDGSWYSVPQSELFMPVPPEFARTYVFDVTKALAYGGPKIRLTFLYKTYIDMIRVDTTPDQPITLTQAPLRTAELRHHGLDTTRKIFEDVFDYVYGDGDGTKGFFTGAYTKYGDVSPLLAAKDDKFTIMGGGDELQLGFEALADPAAGLDRSLIFASYGFYKDRKNDLPRTVEPLPFSGMSNYPYPQGEQYPDDAEHNDYRAEWNTRNEQDVLPGATSASSVVWHEFHTSAWVTTAEDAFSVDTDFLSVRLDNVDATVTNVAPSAGWESTGTPASLPTPGAPGSAITSAKLADAGTDNAVYWRTNLATADRSWNWQVARFDLGADVQQSVRSLMLNWDGHGEPTPGYNAAVYVWNFSSSSWTLLRRADMPADTTVITSEQAVSTDFCFRCHDGTPPSGVVFPPGAVDLGSQWSLITGDFHGSRSGAGFGGSALKQPYVRGQSAIPCSTCHQTHGSASVYHFPSTVNGSAVPPVSGGNTAALCSSCHAGTVRQMHQRCADDCHYDPGHFGDITGLLPDESSNCLSCHKHGTNWVHPVADCHSSCHGWSPGTWRSF